MNPARVMLITGAAGELGRRLAFAFSKAGYAVAAIDKDLAGLQALARDIREAGGDLMPLQCDLTDRPAIDDALCVLVATWGRLDVLINNAAVSTQPPTKRLQDIGCDEFDLMMAVGPQGAFRLMKSAYPFLKKRSGSILNIGSTTGVNPSKGLGAESISKAALHMLTRAAAQEWGALGIRVNGLLPVERAGVGKASQMTGEGTGSWARGPVQGLRPDIGAAAIFLSSDAAALITGQNLGVESVLAMMG
jgi:NAD(P)-dependent dehydrogenase (short-subunit alcohol dehydrogenase family)